MVFLRRVTINIKGRSHVTLKAWCYQCESILAQRSRRIHQLFTFYQRVYGTQGLQLLFRSYRSRYLPISLPRNRAITLGALSVVMGVSAKNCDQSQQHAASCQKQHHHAKHGQDQVYQHQQQQLHPQLILNSGFDWANERLSLGNFDCCQLDLEFLNTLPHNKLCPLCREKSMKYCYCQVGNQKGSKEGEGGESNSKRPTSIYVDGDDEVDGAALMGHTKIQCEGQNPWEPYFSKDQFCVWKRPEKNSMFSYKVYAFFADISAADFLHVQTDLDFRKKWDDTAVALKMIEEDPSPGNNSHLIYWEMQWPKFFANRDYVYCRRYITDEKRKVMFVVSRGTTHPNYPPFSGKVRVNNYWSLMVIKPKHGFHEPGVHYVLTYFDDPGLPIPQSIKSWVTQKQMPDFLNKLYLATKEYAFKKSLTMRDVFNSFTKLNGDYTANASRESWLKRLLRSPAEAIKNDERRK